MKTWLKALGAVLIALCTLDVLSAEEEPSCWPIPGVNAEMGGAPAGVSDDPYWIIWRCTDSAWGLFFSLTEAQPWVLRGAYSDGEAREAWRTGRQPTPTESAFVRQVVVDRGWAAPKVIATIAYRLKENTNAAPTYVAIGTVPAGTTCERNGVAAGGFMRVDRTKVKLASLFQAMPSATYARCG